MSARFACLLVLTVTAACADDDGGTEDTGGGTCAQPLDADVLSRLTTGIDTHFDMKPGTSRDFELGTSECCYSFEAVDACATWSVSPAIGASIDANGVLSIDPSATDGDVFTVTANVEDGRTIITSQVYVYTPEGNPLFGLWREKSQIACEGGGTVTPEKSIGELRFSADHTIRVTWQPFEIYVDYWGAYSYALDTGAFSFDVESGNYVPTDIDASGAFSFNDAGELVLTDVWLGSPQDSSAPASCGHVFMR